MPDLIPAERSRLPSIDEERQAVLLVIGVALAHGERWAFSRAEAAERLGISPEFFERYVAPEIRSIRRGRRRLFSLGELMFWLWRAAEEHVDVTEAVERSSSEG